MYEKSEPEAADRGEVEVDVDWETDRGERGIARVGRRERTGRNERFRSAAIPRVTSSTYFQVNDNYYPGRTCAAVWPQCFSQIIALFIRSGMGAERRSRMRLLLSEKGRLFRRSSHRSFQNDVHISETGRGYASERSMASVRERFTALCAARNFLHGYAIYYSFLA